MKLPLIVLSCVALGTALPAAAAPKAPAKTTAKPVAKKPAAKKPAPKPAPSKPVVRPAVPSPAVPFPAVASKEDPAAPKYQTWALLVGVGKYQSPLVTKLNSPRRDAAEIGQVLTTLGKVPKDNVKILTDDEATRSNIFDVVDNFLPGKVKEGDHVIVFLAGHGVTKGVGASAKSFLLPTDVKGLSTPALESSAVNLSVLADKLSQLKAAQFVQFIDACREDPTPGRAGKPNTLTDALSSSAYILPQVAEDGKQQAFSVSFFACSPGERAFEDPALDHGVFTDAILRGIRKEVPLNSDGAIDMRRLASYVSGQVSAWSEKMTQTADFEISQTPEFVSAAEVNLDAVEVVRVSRDKPSGSVSDAKVKMTLLNLPKARGVSSDQAADILYRRALDKEARRKWEEAEAFYAQTLAADPKFAAAYESLADMQRRQGRNRDSLNTLLRMGASAPATAHAYSVLSQAFTHWSLNGDGDGNTDFVPRKAGPFKTPSTPAEAANFAKVAADNAIKKDANLAEANRALGFALAAMATKNTKDAAIAAFQKARLADAADAANHYALGFGYRFFAKFSPEDKMKSEVEQNAVPALRQAIELRPDYYEAHRELAYCYHLMGETDEAIAQYERANGYRGATGDKYEVAGSSVALAALHTEKAKNGSGDNKTRDTETAKAYDEDAKETSGGDMTRVYKGLVSIGLGSQIYNIIPAGLRNAIGVVNDPAGAVKEKIKEKIRIPGLGGLGF